MTKKSALNLLNVNRNVVTFILCALTIFSNSQNWKPITNTHPNQFLSKIIADSLHNEILISHYQFTNISTLKTRGVASWNGVKWDSLGGGINSFDKYLNPSNPNGIINCGIPYNGKFLVGGQFNSIGNIGVRSLALWDGIKWDSLLVSPMPFGSGPNAPSIYALLKKGNKLYIAGGFDTIAGQSCTGLAFFDGTSYTPIKLPVNSFVFNFDIKEFQNEIYVCGRFTNINGSNPLNNILKFDGTNWVSVGGGIKGNIAEAITMAVYNNELYVGGEFKKSAGNVGENIMKWDGTQWHDVGFGLEPTWGGVRKLIIHKNKLWAFGEFQMASYMQANGAAVFDGVKWCTLRDTLDDFIWGATVYNDSIYVCGSFKSQQGDTMINHVAKLYDDNLFRTCNGVGVEEYQNEFYIKILPNPASTVLHIKTDLYFDEATKIEITNSLGQVVLRLNYNKVIDVSNLSSGCYFIKIESPYRQRFHSKFIKSD